MSYIENLTGNTIEGGLQETLSLGAGNFKIRGFDLTNTGDYLVLSSGIALIDGLRVKSTGNLKLPIVDTFDKYILLRIRTYTEIVDRLTVRKAELSLVIQSTPTIVNNTDLYANIVGTKDVLLGIVDDSGVVNLSTQGALIYYDVPTRLTSVESVNTSQDSSISSLETRATNIENKNTEQDTRLTTLEADTGWVDIVYNTGWSGGTGGQLQCRKIGNQVFLRGGVGQTVTADGNYKAVSTGGIPPTFRPPSEVRVTGMGSSGRSIGWRITVTGNIDVVNQASNTNAAWASVFCSWLLD